MNVNTAFNVVKMVNEMNHLKKVVQALEKQKTSKTLVTIHTIPACHIELGLEEESAVQSLLEARIDALKVSIEEAGFELDQ